MCAININEFDGKPGINKQHDTNTNPEEVLFGSMEEKSEDVVSQNFQKPAHPQPIKPGDLNRDGRIDKTDVSYLKEALKNGDMNGDGKLDRDDYLKLKEIALNSSMYPTDHVEGEEQTVVRPRGDMNGDGRVDKKDLAMFSRVLSAGDMNRDRKVDQTDLELLIKQTGGEETHPEIRHGEGIPISEIDIDGNGTMDFNEWKSGMNNNGIGTTPETEKRYEELFERMGGVPISEIDLDSNGKLDSNDFVMSIQKAKEMGMDSKQISDFLDNNHDGKFDFSDQKANLEREGFIITDEEKCKAAFERGLGGGVDLNALLGTQTHQEIRHEEGIPISEIDIDGNGKIDFNECKSDINNHGVGISPESEKEFEEMFKQYGDIRVSDIDLDGSGKVDLNDIALIIQEAKEAGLDNKQISNIFDKNNDGKFDFSDHKANLKENGFIITDEEKAKARFERAYGDGLDLNALLGPQNGSEAVNPPSNAQIAPAIEETNPDE